MEKSVCVHSWTLKIYHVEETVLVSVRIFVNKTNTYRFKRWKVRTTCKAVNFFLNIARDKYLIYTYIYFYYVGKFWTNILPTNSRARKEDYMKAWNYIKNDCDQETGKEYSTILQVIVKDDRGKAIAWRLVSCKMTCYHVSDKKKGYILSLHFVPSLQSAFCTQSAVCILYLVCMLYLVCSLHFVLTGLVSLFLFERASSPDRNIGARKIS